jgi:hypothetical protein
MANKHVKTINGKKYYYESVRKGDKVTSRYLGPVPEEESQEEIVQEDVETPEDFYTG